MEQEWQPLQLWAEKAGRVPIPDECGSCREEHPHGTLFAEA
jgi:hypothetical protein